MRESSNDAQSSCVSWAALWSQLYDLSDLISSAEIPSPFSPPW